MLEVRNEEYLAEVRAFADKVGLREDLEKGLTYLDTFAEIDGDGNRDEGKTKCVIGKDFAPHSFAFQLQSRNKDGVYNAWFHGGLIYFGPGDTGVDFPQLSVRMGDQKAGWSVHT